MVFSFSLIKLVIIKSKKQKEKKHNCSEWLSDNQNKSSVAALPPTGNKWAVREEADI